MNPNKAIFRVCVGDIQEVAEEQYGTQLTDDELRIVIKQVQDKIITYDPIWDAVGELGRIGKMTEAEDKEFFNLYRS
ncbi:MAG: hypothetical protein KGJ59_10225 [Bacteroidota bacterium]|nr:hypothetical protein [Bacteroidota bacterium]